jgi:DNA-directed RNA polymerase subunit M/transcription elongation factor TFIIS
MVKCPKCGFDLKFCNNCGQLLPPFEKMLKDSKNNLLCPFCKGIIIHCPNCGYSFSENKNLEKEITSKIEKIDIEILNSIIKKIEEKNLEKGIMEIKGEGKTRNIKENLFCAFHPSRKANKECDICSKPLCDECAKNYEDLILCIDDYYNIIREISSINSIENEKNNLISFFISIIAAFLILGNAFSWVLSLNIFPIFSIFLFLEKNHLALISAICSIFIAIGAFLSLKPKREISGGLMIMIFSFASLTIGGGFIIGSILGVIGALLNFITK